MKVQHGSSFELHAGPAVGQPIFGQRPSRDGRDTARSDDDEIGERACTGPSGCAASLARGLFGESAGRDLAREGGDAGDTGSDGPVGEAPCKLARVKLGLEVSAGCILILTSLRGRHIRLASL